MVPENEYHPYYQSFIEPIASSGKSIVEVLREAQNKVNAAVSNLPEEKIDYRYAEGKWTIKQILQHLIDTERVFNYRALRFSRNDKTELQGFDQDDFDSTADANKRELQDLLYELYVLRISTIAMYQSFSDEMLTRIGIASENPMSVRALGYLTAGHSDHHMRVFQERYL